MTRRGLKAMVTVWIGNLAIIALTWLMGWPWYAAILLIFGIWYLAAAERS